MRTRDNTDAQRAENSFAARAKRQPPASLPDSSRRPQPGAPRTKPRTKKIRKRQAEAEKPLSLAPISHEFLPQIVQTLPARVAVLDDAGRIVVANQSWIDYCKKTGFLVSEFDVGGSYLRLCRASHGFCRESGPKAANGIEAVMAGRKHSFYLEYSDQSANRPEWFQMRVSRFHYSGKTWILVSHENITEPKQANIILGRLRHDLEECLDERAAALLSTNQELCREISNRTAAEQALREERNRFRALVETIPHGIVEHDLEGRITFANAVYHGMHGYPEGTLVGQYLWDVLEPFFPEAKETITRNLVEQPLPMPAFHSFPTGEGKSVDQRIDWNYKRDGDGKVTGMVVVVSDISQQRQAELKAHQHLDQLAHVTRVFTMSQMVSGLAHELNQPLAAIANFAQACRYRILVSKLKERAKLLESVEQILLQADRAGQIIRRLRDFVRRADSTRSRENVNDLVDNVLSVLEIEARPHNIRLERLLGAHLPMIAVDRVQIEQVITNLVKNALDATRDLSVEQRRVTLRTEMNAERMLQVSVIDAGKGIADGRLAHIFEPFYTTKQSGMGLGLSISRAIIEAHGGRLDAVKTADRGMTFRFALPVARDGAKT